MDINKIVKRGLWPQSKKTTQKRGIEELESLGYNLFYIGKNADLYTCPGEEPKVLLVRSDRCSVFDIPLNLEIEEKGIIQTSISNAAALFANNEGIKTAILTETVDKNLTVSPRCQIQELCKPLEAQIDGENVQFELIFRNYLTGSLYTTYKEGKDPYGLKLPRGLEQWSKFQKPLFTPTTKGEKDTPLNASKVREKLPQIIDSLEKLFINFSSFALEKGIVIVDTKFEVFIDKNGDWILGDEVLTPESSRYIDKKNFLNKNYISMDKQILRNFGLENNWKEKSKGLKKDEKLEVNVPKHIKNEVLSGYKYILNHLYTP